MVRGIYTLVFHYSYGVYSFICFGQASKHAKTAFHHWKTEGAIKENNNKSSNDMKASKKVLRQKQRQASSKIRESK
jgi:hypothetical protein